MKSVQLNLGCGAAFLPDFINVDKFIDFDKAKEGKNEYTGVVVPKDTQFVQADILRLPFQDNSADYVECMDVIEHLAMRDVVPALTEARRVLKKGSEAVVVTTDFTEIARQFLIMAVQKTFDPQLYLSVAETIYGNQLHEGEFHKTPFTPPFLFRCFLAAGFTKKNISMIAVPTGAKMPSLRGHKQLDENMVRSTMLITTAKK